MVTDAQMIERFGIAARFRLHIRCENCARDSTRCLDIPDVEDAPTSVAELLDSQVLSRQKFKCLVCESEIATVVAVTPFKRREAA